jgi:hypothetical protein
VEASLAARVPRLELVMALIAASVGVITAASGSELELIPFTWEPAVAGLVVGALTGALLRWRTVHATDCDERRERLVLFGLWSAGGAAIGVAVCMVAPMTVPGYIPPPLLDGVAIGGVVAAAASPACYWLLRRARACVRARSGSIVAGADRRSIWSTTAVVLALASLGGLSAWGARAPRLSPALPAAIAATGALIALAVYLADAAARRRVMKLCDEGDGLDPLDGDDDLRAADDLGIGDELLGRIASGGSYRNGGARVPLIRGSAAAALLLLGDASASSRHRALIALGCLGLQLASFCAFA